MVIHKRVGTCRKEIYGSIEVSGVAGAVAESGGAEAVGGDVGKGGTEDGGFGFGERRWGRVFVGVVEAGLRFRWGRRWEGWSVVIVGTGGPLVAEVCGGGCCWSGRPAEAGQTSQVGACER